MFTIVLQACSTIGNFLLRPILRQLSCGTCQTPFVPAAKLVPYMTWLCEVLVDLIYTPYIILMILFVFGVDCVQFADGTGRCK
jgi:hypothetical protein